MRRASADLPRRSYRRHSTAVALFATSAKCDSEDISRSRPRKRALCRTSSLELSRRFWPGRVLIMKKGALNWENMAC